jgi:biopolymer transport protein ExbD
VRADGSFLVRDGVNDKPKPADRAAIVALARNKQKVDPNTPVVIEGDKSVRYERITEVMNALYAEKIKRVGLAVKPAN